MLKNAIANSSKRHVVIFGIVIGIAAVHMFRVGSYLHRKLYHLYYGYLSPAEALPLRLVSLSV